MIYAVRVAIMSPLKYGIIICRVLLTIPTVLLVCGSASFISHMVDLPVTDKFDFSVLSGNIFDVDNLGHKAFGIFYGIWHDNDTIPSNISFRK